MEILTASHEKEGLCGGTSSCDNMEDNQSPATTNCLGADEVTTESKYYKKEKKSETTAVFGKSEANGFFRRTLKSILKIEKTKSTGSYDVDCVSTRSSLKEESEDKSDGVDSGIASEAGDRAASSRLSSSRLSSCTNYTSKTHIISHSIFILIAKSYKPTVDRYSH